MKENDTYTMEMNDTNFSGEGESFTRNIIVGLSSFMYDIIKVKQIHDGVVTLKPVKFFYSMTGDEQFLTDYFLNTDKYCSELSSKLEGNIVTIPSGRFMFNNVSIPTDELGSGNNRANFNAKYEGDFGDEMRSMSARTNFIPLRYDVEMKVKSGSDIERLKIFETVIKKLYKTKKFFIKYGGFPKLPCRVSFPENYNVTKNFNFNYPSDDKRPMLIFNVELLTFMPVIDETTIRNNEEKIETSTANITSRSNEESQGTE